MVSLASIIVLGIGAQWLAWRLRLPSILLLLMAGFLAGPIAGFIEPDELLGETLFPIVSISVGIILFEGGLTLRLNDIAGMRRVVFRLITIGALVTWVIVGLGAYYIVGLSGELSVLLGAIFIVTGPTVVIPLLKHVRPVARVGSILKWEGILIDPVGATVAVLVLEAMMSGRLGNGALGPMLAGVFETLAVGIVLGVIGAQFLIQVFKRYWVPEELQNPFAIMVIIGLFTLSNEVQPESGLLTTTVMGIVLANQRQISTRHLSQFKEDIGVLLLSGLFIVLAARLELEQLSNISGRALVFLALLVFVARPLSVLASTIGSPLSWRERAFIAWIAPRGIVAVSVASLFALELANREVPGAESLIPITFLMVVGTVVIYGLSAAPVANWLGLAQPQPRGVLIVGAHRWAREIAQMLQEPGREIRLVDTNWQNISTARLAGLQAVYASALSEHALDELDLSQIGNLLALTSNDEVNSLASLHFAEHFGRSRVYQLPMHQDPTGRNQLDMEQHGRCLFQRHATFNYLEKRFDEGAILKKVKLTKEHEFSDFMATYGETTLPLFVTDATSELKMFTTDNGLTPRAGQSVIALVDPVDRALPETARLQEVRSLTNGNE
ncbi:MAG: sodium:proton antiporter [Chloroflexi bacterium]|nr:sodium:proton antiporter [Chloroflexota bacterium]